MGNHHAIQSQQPEPKPWPKVAIIVLNWNGWWDTIECLESLQRLTYPNYQIIVVDNRSTDDSVEKIKAWARGEIPVKSKFFDYDPTTKPVQWIEYDRETAEAGGIPKEEVKLEGVVPNRKMVLIQTGKNLGFAGGNNVGIRYALKNRADHVFILNNDTIVEPGALTEMVRIAWQDPNRIGMVAPTVLEYYRPEFIDRLGIVLTKSGLGYDRKRENEGPLLCPSGAAALYSRSMLLAVASKGREFFDEDFFMYCEDMDIGFRAVLRGFKAVLVDRAILFHKGGAPSGGRGLAKSIYFRCRNTIWFIVKNYPVSFLIKYALWILLGQLGGLVRNIGRKEFVFVWRGKIDGLKGVKRMWLKRAKRDAQIRHCDIPISRRPFIFAQKRKPVVFSSFSIKQGTT